MQISLHSCTKWFAAILLVSMKIFQIEFGSIVADQTSLRSIRLETMTFYHGVAKNRSYHTSASGNLRVSVVILIKVRLYFLYQFDVLILLKIK